MLVSNGFSFFLTVYVRFVDVVVLLGFGSQPWLELHNSLLPGLLLLFLSAFVLFCFAKSNNHQQVW